MENELLEAAKELLNDFELYGNPIQLRVIARLRRAVEAAQQGLHPTSGILSDLQAVSTPQPLVSSQAESTTPTCW